MFGFKKKNKCPINAELEQVNRDSAARVTAYNSNLSQSTSSEFSMVVEDVFTITGRGTVLTGKISSGKVRTGDTVRINNQIECKVKGIEMFRKKLDSAQASDNIGLLVDLNRKDVASGDIITK